MKKITLFMALIMLLPCLAGCNGNNSGGDDTSGADSPDTTPDTSAEIAEELKIVENGASRFTIIYPDEPDTELFRAVRSLADSIKEATGVTIKTNSDFIRPGGTHDSEAYEILIGQTNYDETAAVLKDIRFREYAIVQSGNKIVITAHSVDTTIRAINYYCKNLIKNNLKTDEAGNTSLVFTPYTFISKPAITSLTIAGNELRDYKIVYAKQEAGYDGAAELLRELIGERYGYMLDVVADTQSEATDKEILIGPTNRSQSAAFMTAHPCLTLEYALGITDGRLLITGKPYSCLQAASRFSAIYLNGVSDTVALTEGEVFADSLRGKKSAPLAEGADVRIMTANILAEMESWGGKTPVARRAEIFAAVLDVYQPDVVGVQEVTSAWYRLLPNYVGDKYKFLHPTTSTGFTNYSSLLYDKTKYDVIDSGVEYFSTEGPNNIRLVTYAVFSSKTSDIKFCVFNSHWCWDSPEHAHKQAAEEADLIKRVTAQYPYPYFCTADYNTRQETENYNYFLGLTGAVDAKYAARDAGKLLNVAGGCGELGSPRGESGNSIDHIFMSASIEARAFATVTYNQTYDLSDHSPKYVDAKFK